jgi:DsbC/DsbD-like thiol-disulfide interchange protein
MKINLRLVCALVGALSVSGASAARAQNLHPSDVVQAELLTGWRTSDGTHIAALRLNLAEGWKTYWRVPGNAGIPPQLDWSGSQNVASVQTHWPQPAVFEQNGMYSIGYHDELVLPIEFTPIRADLPMAPVDTRGLAWCGCTRCNDRQRVAEPTTNRAIHRVGQFALCLDA